MQDSPLLVLVLIGVSAYVTKLWLDDFRAAQRGTPNPNALPGATSAPRKAILIAIVGTAALLAAETWGELRLGISAEQTKMTALFAAYTLLAAFVEEIIFRGYLVIQNRGTALRWVGIIAASVLFAAIHPFVLEGKGSAEGWQLTTKEWFSTVAIFVGSLWFYFLRFAWFNAERSLWPCFAAHLTKNAGVIAIKAAQGHLVGLY